MIACCGDRLSSNKADLCTMTQKFQKINLDFMKLDKQFGQKEEKKDCFFSKRMFGANHLK